MPRERNGTFEPTIAPTLEIDDTCDAVRGRQQQWLFHAHSSRDT